MADEKTPLLKGIVINIPLPDKEINNNIFSFDTTKSLTLEELLRYQSDPWWQNLRKACLIIFWTFLFVIFSLACILIILQYDSCPTTNMIITTTTTTLRTTNLATVTSELSSKFIYNDISIEARATYQL
ncbi:uncharacterized protein LOC129618491 [Condylostylus longicornis]|uniref:uncharacterized protein LOC129618491 n=1 Tax=Condylostylus longicornis TaxID=2530218 RepID=UPI00244E215B|nr:uncharacterized protein LOC129618491 [Condylostylus longicornis]